MNSITHSNKKSLSIGLTITTIFILGIIWTIISAANQGDASMFYPSLGSIFLAFGKIFTSTHTLKCFLYSFLRIILVIAISALISFVIAFFYAQFPIIKSIIGPILAIIKASPIAIILVYFYLNLSGEIACYIIAFMVVYPVIQEALFSSLDNIDETILLSLKLEDKSFFEKYFKIHLPMIAPYIFMSILQSFGLGLKVMIMGEYLCQNKNSIGSLIRDAKEAFYYDSLLAYLILIILVVIVIEFIIKIIDKKMNPYKAK